MVGRLFASEWRVFDPWQSVEREQEWIGGKSFASSETRAYEQKIRLQVLLYYIAGRTNAGRIL